MLWLWLSLRAVGNAKNQSVFKDRSDSRQLFLRLSITGVTRINNAINE